jgi:hypothetical protein
LKTEVGTSPARASGADVTPWATGCKVAATKHGSAAGGAGAGGCHRGRAQGSEAEGGHASARALVRPAAACGTRSLVKTAGPCVDAIRMPLEVTLIAEGGERRQAEPGSSWLAAASFHLGELRIHAAEVRVSARVTPDGEARDVSSHGATGRELPSTLGRIAR